MAQDTADARQCDERAHRCTGAKWPRTLHTQHNTPSGHTAAQQARGRGDCTRDTTHPGGTPAEQEPSGPGQRTRNATQRTGTPVNRSQVAQDTAHTCATGATERRAATNHTTWVGRTGASQPTHRARSRGGTPRPLVRARPGCIGDHGKPHPEPWKQPPTGEPVESPGGGRLPSSGAPQLEPQG